MKTKIISVLALCFSIIVQVTDVNCQTLTLPSNFPQYKVTANNSPAEGYYFTVPTVTNMGPGYMIIMDDYGTPIYYRYFATFFGSLALQPNGMLSFRHRNPTILHHFLMDSKYNIVDTIETIVAKLDAHDIIAMTNGHYLIFGTETRIVDMSTIVPGGKTNASVIECVIQELDENENLVFEWKSTNKFDITATNYDLTASSIDYLHINSLELDIDGNILLQSRFMDELTKINRQTGDIMWRMGGKRNQFTFTQPGSIFSWAHDARRLPNGNLVMFDNGFGRDEKYSRAVEYEIDEVNKTANLVWSYDGDKKTYSPTTGSTRRLANGNTVIGYGFDVSSPAIVEVNPDNSIAFSLDFPKGAGSYRSLKFPWKTTLFEPATYSVEFGEWDGYTESQYLLPIKNNSDQTLTLTGYSTRTNAFTIEDAFPISIPANGTVNLTILYYPELINTGFIKDVLTINSDINTTLLVQRISQQIQLSGTKSDIAPPVVSFPQAGKNNMPLDTVIYVNFDEPVRLINNTEFNYLNIDASVILKKNNATGEDVPFNAVMSTDKKKITIKPVTKLAHTQAYYVAVKTGFEDYSNNAGTTKDALFNTIDLTAPVPGITPSNGSTYTYLGGPVTISYNEPVRNTDNSDLTVDYLKSIIKFKSTDVNGTDVSFTPSVSIDKTTITVTPDSYLSALSVYYAAIQGAVEDFNNNPAPAISTSFTTGSSTGVPPPMPENSVKIYPNPGSGIFRIELKEQKTTRFRITDINGRVIYDSTIPSVNNHIIDLSNQPDGVFFLKIEQSGYYSGQFFKLVKQND